ncbi:MAG: iron-sulfur cluster assembly scaffold protein [bacterium]|nr:iron-sulfur cluster assembly scaffold protein [bacterium]
MQQKNYSQIVLDHYRNPRNFGKLKEPTHTAEEVNPLCGDEIKVYLRVKNGKNGKNGKIEDIRYEARGCALSIAVASILAERIVNRELRIEETGKMEKSDIEQMLGIKISPARESCILLSLNAINKALSS